MRLFDAIREELVPYGTQTFPSVASASLHLVNGICASICSILLFISSPGCLINALHFLSQPSVLYLLPSSPIHPEVDNGPGELRSPQDRCGVGTLSLLESSYAASPLKYGAGWKKEELPEKDFRDYSLVLFP